MVSGKMKTKGQLKIQQMAFVLIAVTLFFAIVGLFVLTFSFSGLRESAAILEEENAIALVTRLANSPEFSCEEVFDDTNFNCIDADKVMALKENVELYSKFWGVKGIEIRKIYPELAAGEIECKRENYPDCNVIDLIPTSKGIGVSSFVSLCRKDFDEETSRFRDKCEIAKIIVTY
jgi:hypothetical protein